LQVVEHRVDDASLSRRAITLLLSQTYLGGYQTLYTRVLEHRESSLVIRT
jgi:hypothetical protein